MEVDHPLGTPSDMVTPLTGAFHLVITNPSFRWSIPRDVAEHAPARLAPPEIRAHTPSPSVTTGSGDTHLLTAATARLPTYSTWPWARDRPSG